MTHPQDPFATPSSAPAPQAPLPAPPPPTAPPAPYGYGAYPGTAPRPAVPGALAAWTIILTGALVFFSIVAAFVSPSAVEEAKAVITSPAPTGGPTFTSQELVNVLVAPLQLAAFIVLALWWGRVREIRAADGYHPGGIPAVEWWGWFVPFANYVLPAMGMRSITKRLVGVGPLLGWWLAWCAYWTVNAGWGFYVFFATLNAIDPVDGSVGSLDFMDLAPGFAWAMAALVAIAWAFLTYIVARTTSRLRPAANPPLAPPYGV